MFLDQFFFNPNVQKHGNTETQKLRNTESGFTHTNSDEYSEVAFCKNATMKMRLYFLVYSHFCLSHLAT